MKKHLANIVTVSRIIGTVTLLFLDVMSRPFDLVYIWCGLSDVLDGFIARKTGTVSRLGSKLDSISDLFFYTVMMCKIKPFLDAALPVYIWVLIYLAVGLRFLLYIYVGIRGKSFLSRHSVLNKATGGLMFFLPFVARTPYLALYSLFNVIIAHLSSLDEIIAVIKNKEYHR